MLAAAKNHLTAVTDDRDPEREENALERMREITQVEPVRGMVLVEPMKGIVLIEPMKRIVLIEPMKRTVLIEPLKGIVLIDAQNHLAAMTDDLDREKEENANGDAGNQPTERVRKNIESNTELFKTGYASVIF